MLHLAATSMGVKQEGTMMSSFVYATTSMFAGQCRVLMFMLGVHSTTDKLQAGKKTRTWKHVCVLVGAVVHRGTER